MSQTVLVTGASTGIGLATAKYFASRGWNVVATMRTPEGASPDLVQPKILITRLDVLDQDSIEQAVTAGLAKFGHIDVLVNNAGFGVMGAFEATPLHSIKRQFDTNVFGLMSVVRAVLPHFRSRKTGVIVNISSVGGLTTMPLFSLYHSTKFAVEGFTESLQFELEGFGIRVKLVEPGAVLTDFAGRSLDRIDISGTTAYQRYCSELTRKIEKAAKHGQKPEEVARIIYRAATDKSKRLRYVSGKQAIAVLALRKLLPEYAFRKLVRATINSL